MKRLIVGAIAALALAAGATPAAATHIADRAQDFHACEHQDKSPSCNHAGVPGGITSNHNETLVLDA